MEHRNGRIPPSPTHDYLSSNPRRHPLLNSSPIAAEPLYSPVYPPAYPPAAAAAAAYSQQLALEEALCRLSLGGSPYIHHRPESLHGGAPIVAGGEGFISNGSLDSYNTRVLGSAVNGGGQTMMGGYGVGPVNHSVDPLGNRTAAPLVPNSWYKYDSVPLQHEFDHIVDHNQLHAYLRSKKQQQLNFHPQSFPSPNASQFVSSSLNGYGPNSTNNVNISRSNLYNPLLPEHVNLLNLEDFRGRFVEFAKDQNGCRILQLKFENPSHEEIEMLLSEVIDHVGDLMINQFGNYLIQKLVAVCNDEQRTRIIRSMSMTPFQLIIICKNPHGAKAVQKLLECLVHPHQVALLLTALSPGAAALAKDPNGHHVIQYCLIHFSYSCNQHILKEITDHCFEIAIDRSGCCVLQTCVQKAQGESRRRLVSQILANAIHLALDPYGNYVLQHMLGLRIPELTEDLLRQLEGNHVYFACNKYASNVVEKCLIETNEEQCTRIIMELVRSTSSHMLLLDPYGNFVIQSALQVSKGLARNSLINLVNQNVPSMRSNLYGKKVLASLERRKVQQVHD